MGLIRSAIASIHGFSPVADEMRTIARRRSARVTNLNDARCLNCPLPLFKNRGARF